MTEMLQRPSPEHGSGQSPPAQPAVAGPAPRAAPGWYPNPDGSASKRWWSGTAWTDAVSADSMPPTPAPFYGPAYAVVKTNGLAVASLCCSIAGLLTFGLAGVPGVIFGFVARSRIRQARGAETGDGMALAGIIIGFATAALGLLTLIALGSADTTGGTP